MTPATLLTAVLLLPAAAFAGDNRPYDPDLGRSIAEQGNRALARIHADTREAVHHLSPIPSREYAAQPVSEKRGHAPSSCKGVKS